jgi:tRNA A-37 threonylcarbamoyl transferase component Bud32/tetratricopeptide (TPR) repeat protein
MKPEVSDLFGELRDMPREEREQYYTTHAIPGDVRREVESLLSFDHGRHLGAIVQNAVGLVFQEPVPDRGYCGPFRLLRVIGRGGMGVVYLAERADGEVRQQVAVKLLRSSFDSPDARRRFLQERQILANLAHPNLARLIDAGHRTDGQPYLAMEYIAGHPIDDYSRGLAVQEKVALMATLCEAIAYAHRNLVVHRDLKPGNILVDASGNPRVLDFGIAKLIDASEAAATGTMTVERRLTPEYASPEQIRGEPVTTATDIYSLGAVLYKLLTGVAPGRETPLPPGRTCPAARGDLDAIILKALRPEPHGRYATADKLAEDLHAWLERRPVSARYGEPWYRLRRHLRRHWGLAVASAVAASGLIGGLAAARMERDAAQERFQLGRKLANEFFTVEKDVQGLPGSTALRERIVKTSIDYLEALSKRAGSDWRLKAEIAAGYRKAAEAQGISRGVNLGHPAEARESLRKAALLLHDVNEAAPGNRAVLHDRIELVELETRIEYDTKNLKALEAKLKELEALLKRYEAGALDEPAEWQFAGRIYESMAVSARELSRLEMPMHFAKRSVELQRKVTAHDRSLAALLRLANALSAYAGLLYATGDLSEAVRAHQESLAVLERITHDHPEHYTTQLNIANTHATMGRILADPLGPSLRQTEAGVQHLEESLRMGRRLTALDPHDTQIRFNHAVAAWRLADVLRSRDPVNALARYDEAIAILRPMGGSRFRRDIPLAATLAESTWALRALGRNPESQRRLDEAASLCSSYRNNAVIHETCTDFVSRAQAAVLLAGERPLAAAAVHRDWLEHTAGPKQMEDAKEDIHSAYVLATHYALLRDALSAAEKKVEADDAERKRRAVVEIWKAKLTGRNDAESLLPQ